MSAIVRGVVPLQFGVVVTTGFITENISDRHTGGKLNIEDENGDIATNITGFGLMREVTLEVIPKSAVTAGVPAVGDVFAWGPSGSLQYMIVDEDVEVKQVKKNVEKWTIKGHIYPNITAGSADAELYTIT
jgi:hypothetical protein